MRPVNHREAAEELALHHYQEARAMPRKKATGGTWTADHDHQGPTGERWSRVIADTPSGTVTVAHCLGDAYLMGNGSSRDNANLLAAAPEMLKALRLVAQGMKTVPFYVQEAIAAAEGRAS